MSQQIGGTKNLKEYMFSVFSEKYTQPKACLEMILTGKTELLNPAYNEKYAAWLQPKIDAMATNWIYEDRGGDFGLKPSFSLIGTGAMGSNYLYAHQKVLFDKDKKGENDKDNWLPTQAFDFDTWSITNLPRIPFKDFTDDKKVISLAKKNVCTTDMKGNEDDFNDPLFIEGTHNKLCNDVPFGAMDLRTRKNLWQTKSPFIVVSQKDDEIRVVLCPEPHGELDLAVEGYGKIDIDFTMPAFFMVAEWFLPLIKGDKDTKTPQGKIYKMIDEYKMLHTEVFESIYSTSDTAYADVMYEVLQHSGFDNDMENFIEVARLWTYLEMYNLTTTEEGFKTACEYADISKDKVPKHKKFPIELWNKMANTELLVIKKKDVDKWLEPYRKL